jgi:hypothetical protein
MELASHLSDITDPHYNQCLNALVALGIHTQIGDGIKTFADTETTICMELFRVLPQNHQKAHNIMTSLASIVRDNAPDLSDSKLQECLKNNNIIVADVEKFWVNSIKDVIAQVDPEGAKNWELGKGDKNRQKKFRTFFGSDTFLKSYAKLQVIVHANKINVHLEDMEINEKAEQYLRAFKTPLQFMITILKKFANVRGYTLEHHKENRENNVWDYMIAFAIGSDHSIGKAKMFVVTEDKDIKKAAVETGCGQYVMKLNEYLNSLGTSL